MSDKIKTGVCVVGGGSGGVGACYGFLKSTGGAGDILLVEQDSSLGGASTNSGVNCWEPGVAGLNTHRELYRSLLGFKRSAVGVGKTVKLYSPEKPWGLTGLRSELTYESSLRRSSLPGEKWTRVVFEPEYMSAAMENLLRETGRIKILFNTTFLDTAREGQRIKSVKVYCADEDTFFDIEADIFIDCTADIAVCRNAGCKTAFGEEIFDCYGEEDAPEQESRKVNGVSLIFRAAPSDTNAIDRLPAWVEDTGAEDWLSGNKPAVAINTYLDGDLNFNILPIMNGDEYFRLPAHERLRECKARALIYWNWLQREKGFENYCFRCFAPRIGVRESYRLIGKYVLNESDVKAGFLKQKNRHELIALADHAVDLHGSRNVKARQCQELEQPYGIPYSCLLSGEFENLSAACRGASFSHIAASSCRLSRTMLELGEAAGTAAAIATENGLGMQEIKAWELRNALHMEEYENDVIKKWGL